MIALPPRSISCQVPKQFKSTHSVLSAQKFCSIQVTGTNGWRTTKTVFTSIPTMQLSNVSVTSGVICSKISYSLEAAQCSREWRNACKRKFKHWLPRTCIHQLTPQPIESIALGLEEPFSHLCNALTLCLSRSKSMKRKAVHVSSIANASELAKTDLPV